MRVVLLSLSVHGPDRKTAEVSFATKRQLIRGPSETGKSYIYDTLWFMLGGNERPETFPLTEGYQEFRLRFSVDAKEYEIRRALSGGPAAVYVRALSNEEALDFSPLDVEVGELLVELSGAQGKQILRNHSKRGPVTGDDIRHWALWSQTELPSKKPTVGEGQSASKREASFHLFLTGTDDAGVQLRKTQNEVDRARGELAAAENALARVESVMPDDLKREEVEESLERVDEILSAMTSQYEARASLLKQLRREVVDATDSLKNVQGQRKHVESMISRFELLERKYANDLERLGATNEGVAFFEVLPTVACPLCASPTVLEAHVHDPKIESPDRYRKALAAEAEKIRTLSVGLKGALGHERERLQTLQRREESRVSDLAALQNREARVLNNARVEFAADPKTLALRRSELANHLGNFDEIKYLKSEIERLTKLTVRKRITVNRESGAFGRKVADAAKVLLEAWGLNDIENISLDDEACDLRINDRTRLSFGAGMRGIYLSALVVSFMENALAENLPHLGVVVLDSPLKAYADPKSTEIKDVPSATVIGSFYTWLSAWNGLGQVIVLENEDVDLATAATLNPTVFTRIRDNGRYGFYPLRDSVRIQPPLDGAQQQLDPGSTEDPEESV
ncbi:hypothetical protein AB4Y40_41605 [Paraburkholderia sp. EG287B]|uniref:hypothetical protein n=1 Tax=Paraburkholderia sp. EG287B TaxID=3237010 RepID=UPI0034D2934E